LITQINNGVFFRSYAAHRSPFLIAAGESNNEMAHIADLHNSGRCGQLRTLENARGAYAQLIGKEARNVEFNERREALKTMGITCPRCALPTIAARCENCRYFPVSMPSKEEVDRKVADLKKIRNYQLRTAGDASASGQHRPASSECPAAESDKLERLEKLIADERAQRRLLLDRVQKLTALAQAIGEKV
jgi:hypothetical protein